MYVGGPEFTTIVGIKNDGGWHTKSIFERCMTQARHDFMAAGGWEWENMLVTKLPCDDRKNHYPDLCEHYEVVFSV